MEDPVEIDIDDIEQIQVADNLGFDFAQTLRHLLRHDPDVIMLGEIRDEETAKIANKAALTGHLVISTLHTNDAASSITRLVEMGIEPYLLSTSLLGVLSQRLVRQNCLICSQPESINPAVRERYHLSSEDIFYKGTGCPTCNGTGYHGRTSVCELLTVTPEISQLISETRSTAELHRAAVNNGMTTINENALRLAKLGKSSLAEAIAL